MGTALLLACLLFPCSQPGSSARAQDAPPPVTETALSPAAQASRRDGLAALSSRRLGQALEDFQRFERQCACAEAAFLKGRVLLELERPESASQAFQRALQLQPAHLAAGQHLALALERLGRWDEAAQAWEHALGLSGAAPPDSLRSRLSRAVVVNRERQHIADLSRLNPQPQRISDRVNSTADDYMPQLDAGGNTLWFTSNRPGGMDPEGRAGVHREDIWVSSRTPEGDWQPARLLPQVNTPASEGSGSLTADGRLLVFGVCDHAQGRGDCDLFVAERGTSGWSATTALSQVNSPFWDSHPSIAADGSWLVFASNRPGGLGGRDLWVSRRDSLGRFGPAANLGAPINTSGDEAGPFLHMDGRSLYFSSDGHTGFGGLDLFFSKRDALGTWEQPRNLGPPFNTANPDLGLSLAGDGSRAVFASRREGRPDLDLYETSIPACCPADSTWLMLGRVVEAGSGKALPARVRIEALHQPDPEWREVRAQADGIVVLPLAAGEYLLFADHPEHLFACRLICAGRGEWPGGAWRATGLDTLVLELPILQAGASLVLDALRFEFNDDRILPGALPILERVHDLLMERRDLGLELRGHTDDVGSESHNLDLSLRRAQAVKGWLLAVGIQDSRMTVSGVGDREPRLAGSSPSARAANRRTEMRLFQYRTSEVHR